MEQDTEVARGTSPKVSSMLEQLFELMDAEEPDVELMLSLTNQYLEDKEWAGRISTSTTSPAPV